MDYDLLARIGVDESRAKEIEKNFRAFRDKVDEKGIASHLKRYSAIEREDQLIGSQISVWEQN